MLFSSEASKALINEAVNAIPYGKLVQIALTLQSGDAIRFDTDNQPIAGFMIKHTGSEYGVVNPEYKSMLVEAVGRRVLENSAGLQAVEDIIREGLLLKQNFLSEIIIGLENNEMRSLIIPTSLSGMFVTVDVNKSTSRPKALFYELIKKVASVLYCELELA